MSRRKDKNEYEQTMPVIEDDLLGIGQSSDFSKAIKEMFSGDEPTLAMKSELTDKQICNLNISKQMADTYDVELLKLMYYRFLALRVSKARKGRKEAVDMTRGIFSMKRLEALENSLKGGIKK